MALPEKRPGLKNLKLMMFVALEDAAVRTTLVGRELVAVTNTLSPRVTAPEEAVQSAFDVVLATTVVAGMLQTPTDILVTAVPVPTVSCPDVFTEVVAVPPNAA